MKNERWVWLTAAALVLSFWVWRVVVAPLPFYAFQSDPELHYYINSLLLANGLPIEHTDHPGTALQWTGAVMARGMGLHLPDAFNPDALRHFYLIWQVIALASLTGTGFWLAHRLKGRGPPFDKLRVASQSREWAVALLVLLLAYDYQTLVYWLTFTPESAFFVLYFPGALFVLFRAREPGGCSLRQGLGLAVLLGFVTTIKLTLWPVTLFLLVQLAAAQAPSRTSPAWRRFLAFMGTAVVTFVVVASLFARHRLAPWRWILALVEHSGRYGAVRPGEGLFPPWSLGFQALKHALALQDYTTLPVFGAVIALAIWSWRTRGVTGDLEGEATRLPAVGLAKEGSQDAGLKPRAEQRGGDNALHPGSARIAAGSFIAALLLLFLMFFKHPYQGKYLMPASVLLLVYVVGLVDAGRLPPRRWVQLLCLICACSAGNAVLTQRILFDHVLARDARVAARIDAWLAAAPHDALVFSSRLPHPLPAFREALRPPIEAEYFRRFGRVELTGTYSLDFQRVAAADLPALTGARKALAFLNTPTADPHWRLVDALPEDDLYVYVPALPTPNR